MARQSKINYGEQLRSHVMTQRKMVESEKRCQTETDLLVSERVKQINAEREKYLSQLPKCYRCKRPV